MTGQSRRTDQTTNTCASSITLAYLCPLLVVLLIVASMLATPAGAQESPPIQTGPAVLSMDIVTQTSFVAADGLFTVDLTIDFVYPKPGTPSAKNIAANLEVSAIVFGRLQQEGGVGLPATQPLNRTGARPLSLLSRPDRKNAPNTYRLNIPIRSGEPFDKRPRVLVPDSGVYPLVVEVRSPNGLLATARTHLIRLPQETDSQANNAPPPVTMLLAVSPAEGLSIEDTIGLLTAHPDHPLTVLLQEGSETQLLADREMAERFRVALGDRTLISAPILQLDPSALAEIGQQRIYYNAVNSTAVALSELGLNLESTVTVTDRQLTGQGVNALLDAGISTVVVDGTQATSGYLEVDGRRLQVLAVDRELSSTFAMGESSAVLATRVLARLSLRGEIDGSAVVVGGNSVGPDPLRAINMFLAALAQPGAPRPLRLAEMEEGRLSVRLAELPTQDLAGVAELLSAVETSLDTYQSLFSSGGVEPSEYRDRMVSSLTIDRNSDDRHRALKVLGQQLTEELSAITLPKGQPLTMAARSGPIPLVVENDANGPRQIMLRFLSDKIVTDAHEQLIVVEPGTSSVDVEIEVLSLGVSPLEVSAWSPDGKTQLATNQFYVRSTAVPGLSLLLSLGAVASLGVWWVFDAKRRRNVN